MRFMDVMDSGMGRGTRRCQGGLATIVAERPAVRGLCGGAFASGFCQIWLLEIFYTVAAGFVIRRMV
ncbi:hypothetical protein KYG_12434 [Acidovorax sp. NO-1]|nr:hypothetical protein KYG_12434 [Acidovorax sp. NO-1]